MKIKPRYIIIVADVIAYLAGGLFIKSEIPTRPMSLGEAIGSGIGIYFDALEFSLVVTGISTFFLLVSVMLKKKEFKIGFFVATLIAIIIDIWLIKFN